jgi:hypothetical protein
MTTCRKNTIGCNARIITLHMAPDLRGHARGSVVRLREGV